MDIDSDDILGSETSVDVEPENVTDEPVGESGPIKQLRHSLKKANDELAVAKERDHLRSYADIGLDPETGMGKAVASTYQGDGSDLAEFAETEFGYTFQGFKNPLAAELNAAYSRLDQASIGAGSVGAPSQADILAQAERRGDHQTTLNIKAQQVAGWFR